MSDHFGDFYCSYNVLYVSGKPKENLVFVELKRYAFAVYFMNSKITVMFQVSWNLFHLSKHIPTTTQILRLWKGKWWFSVCFLWMNLPFSLMFQIGQGQTVLNILIHTVNTFNYRVLQTSEKSNSLPPSMPLFTECFCWVLGNF